jgi:hypothetical protein
MEPFDGHKLNVFYMGQALSRRLNRSHLGSFASLHIL